MSTANRRWPPPIRNPESAIRNRQCGQALVEYAIVFPLQLMLTLAIIQLAHTFVAKQILDYAAFCGARAALVGLSYDDSLKAAAIPMSRIAGPSGVTEPDYVEVPGWGVLPNTGAARQKSTDPYGRFEIRQVQVAGEPAVRCEIDHAYELRVPIGNMVSYQLADVFLGVENLEMIGGAPHIRIQATCTLPQPWGG